MLARTARRACTILLVACAALAAGAPAAAAAESAPYPNRPIRLVIPFPAGGPLDTVGRAIAQKLTDAWSQSVVVDNRPGAGGNIGADLVAKSAPDGYTIVMGALSTHAANPSLYPSMPYDAVKDFAPITLVAITPNVLVVNPSLPVHSVLIAYAYAHPGTLSVGSGSNGSAGHLAGELLKVDALQAPDMRERLALQGAEAAPTTPQRFAQFSSRAKGRSTRASSRRRARRSTEHSNARGKP